MKRRWLIVPAALLLALAAAILIYASDYYHADEEALSALESTEEVTVTRTDYGWFFDGPSEDTCFIFYPGAKVEETAYAPLMQKIAESGVDAALVKMPLRMAILSQNKADAVMDGSYAHYYIGGHSLGGYAATNYAAAHESLDGVILLAAYPTKTIGLPVLSIYGSRDGVLSQEKYEAGKALTPMEEFIIDGGNHALFGNYGFQEGDSEGTIDADTQQFLTAEHITKWINAA